jgi:hypothetical protein
VAFGGALSPTRECESLLQRGTTHAGAPRGHGGAARVTLMPCRWRSGGRVYQAVGGQPLPRWGRAPARDWRGRAHCHRAHPYHVLGLCCLWSWNLQRRRRVRHHPVNDLRKQCASTLPSTGHSVIGANKPWGRCCSGAANRQATLLANPDLDAGSRPRCAAACTCAKGLVNAMPCYEVHDAANCKLLIMMMMIMTLRAACLPKII